MDETTVHRINVQHVAHFQAPEDTPAKGVPANLYRSANYVVIDIGLPRCQPQHVRVMLSADAVLVEAERHPGTEAAEEARDYQLHELPAGSVRRFFQLPVIDLALHDADAHFANGMLTVNIPTKRRDAYRHEVRGEA